ncbi:conserved hypothetical protein [Agrobacterium fabacearum CFBP 5771]|uniref:DUF6074 family protein n=1 Tax=Agrobacterium tumefaciens TaxID=358 RepID=UPI00046E9274|nr:DUF6074 family protein [Agrobacterium tumefaciens]CVI14818.1 conserved hypothetical protein [Agrobacterium fabacearum CFBP 5771]
MTKLKLPDPPLCKLIVFPLSAQIGRVRHVAGKYLEQSNEDAQARYWRVIEDNLRKLLIKHGCADAEISRHILVFREAVQKEINQRAKQRRPIEGPTDPKGAA